MPDASVVESIWLRRNAERNKLEAARGKMGDAVDSLLFYQSARHAIYLADVLGKRGTKLVHAHRSDAVVTTWLLKQLMPAAEDHCRDRREPRPAARSTGAPATRL